MVLGGHGDDMVPIRSYTTVGGQPIERLIAAKRLEEIEKRTRGGGGEIVELMKTSSYYAAGTAVYKMVEAYMLDRKQVLPCAAYLDGEYGVKGLFAGVPVVIGAGGVERVVEIQLTAAEKTAFDSSVGARARTGRGDGQSNRGRKLGRAIQERLMAEAEAVAAPAIAAGMTADERHWLLRRLHSLSGIIPIGGFLFFHLFENAFVLKGGAMWWKETEFTRNIPFQIAVEAMVLWIPILYHAIYGLVITATAQPNDYPYERNYQYTLQRITRDSRVPVYRLSRSFDARVLLRHRGRDGLCADA